MNWTFKEKHLEIDHDGEKIFDCNYCHKKYARIKSLQNHERLSHKDEYLQRKTEKLQQPVEKPYGCNLCDKKFADQKQVMNHVKIHTGEKPYSCNYCHKGFSQKCNLKVHERIHTGEKPYSCKKCHKRFSHQTALKNHENNVNSCVDPNLSFRLFIFRRYHLEKRIAISKSGAWSMQYYMIC